MRDMSNWYRASVCVYLSVQEGGGPRLYTERLEEPRMSERDWKAKNTLEDPIKERR